MELHLQDHASLSAERLPEEAHLVSHDVTWADLEDWTGAWEVDPASIALYGNCAPSVEAESQLHDLIWEGMKPLAAIRWAITQSISLPMLQTIALSALHFREGDRYEQVYDEENWSTQNLSLIAYSMGVPIPPGGFRIGAASFPCPSHIDPVDLGLCSDLS